MYNGIPTLLLGTNDTIYRRVHLNNFKINKYFFFFDDNEEEISVNLKCGKCLNPDSARQRAKNPELNGVVSLMVEYIKNSGEICSIIHTPSGTGNINGNDYSHCSIFPKVDDEITFTQDNFKMKCQQYLNEHPSLIIEIKPDK